MATADETRPRNEATVINGHGLPFLMPPSVSGEPVLGAPCTVKREPNLPVRARPPVTETSTRRVRRPAVQVTRIRIPFHPSPLLLPFLSPL